MNHHPHSPHNRSADRGAASSWAIALFAALVASVLVLGVMLAILMDGDEATATAGSDAVVTTTSAVSVTSTSTAAPATTDSSAPAPTTTFGEVFSDADDAVNGAAAPTPTGLQPLGLRGMGLVEYGMTVAEAEAVLEATLDFGAPASEGCFYASDPTDVNSPLFMVITETADPTDGTIVRIDLGEIHNTRSGIHFGSTKAEVIAAYGDRIVASPHPYGSGPGSEYLTFVPTDPADADHRLIMETSDDRVVGIRSGLLPQVEWTEGCA